MKKNLPVPRYILEDSKKETIIGSFFEDELVRFIPNDEFDIQVVKIRIKKKYINIFDPICWLS